MLLRNLSILMFSAAMAVLIFGAGRMTSSSAYLAVLYLGSLGLVFGFLAYRQRSNGRNVENDTTKPSLALQIIGTLIIGASLGLGIVELMQGTLAGSAISIVTVGEPWLNRLPASLAGSVGFAFSDVRIWLPAVLFGAVWYYLRRRSSEKALKALQRTEPDHSAGPVKRPKSPPPERNELAAALASSRNAFLGIGVFSGMSNILMLTGAFFMLQVYDRVLPSRSVPTLVALAVLVVGLFIAQAILDMIRARILSRIGAALDEDLSGRVYDAVVRLPLRVPNRGEGLQPLRDLDSVRTFLSGQGPAALFDLPWLPIYLVIIFAFHTMLGVTALIGAVILIFLTLLTELLTRRPMMSASGFAASRNGLAEASRRNAEAITAMGMVGRLGARWAEANQNYMASNHQASDVAGGFGSISRSLRMMLQSAIIGIGAYLVIHGEATAGIIIAGSILVSRALAPVDLAIAHWRGFVAARQGWQRLNMLLDMLPAQISLMALDAPSRTVSVKNAIAIPPGKQTAVVQDVSFALERGQGLGIIGPSASGKSSLARLLVGAWQPTRGTIRLDGAALAQWTPEDLGCHLGYLPQDVELLAGTVAQNISRFEFDADPKTIIAAANAAGVHDLIVTLPDGYETELCDQATTISVGQRQRIGLARALYGDPFLVVLDEPNSNLDAEGEVALTQAIFGVRARGGVVIVIAHRPSALAGVDMLLVMAKGRALQFGPKDEVLAKLVRPENQNPSPLKVVKASGKTAP